MNLSENRTQDTDSDPGSLSQFNRSNSIGFSRLTRLAAKELLEIMRDRRTIFTLVLMPILVYPLLGTIVQKFMLNSLSNIQKVEYFIAAETNLELALLERRVSRGGALLEPDSDEPAEEKETAEAESAGKTNKKQVEQLILGQIDAEPVFRFVKAKDGDLEKYVGQGVFELGVRILNKEQVSKRVNDFEHVQFELIQ